MQPTPSMDVGRVGQISRNQHEVQENAAWHEVQSPTTPFCGRNRAHAFVIVNVPVPLQPVPVSDHVPVIVLPAAVPVIVIVLPDGVPDCTVNPNDPLTLPLKFPLNVKDPLAVSPETKHGELLVNVRLLMLRELSPLTFSDVPNVKIEAWVESTSDALHVPLIEEAEFELLEPHPAKVKPITRSVSAVRYFIQKPRS